MQQLRTILLSGMIMCSVCVHAQKNDPYSYDAVNTKSYALYEKAAWDELLDYGKQAVDNGQDFALLRARMGYAAFMLNNFSEAIKQYEQVLKNDSYNSTAHYYIYLSRKYLNQHELASAEAKYLTPEAKKEEKLDGFAFTNAGVEVSSKGTDHVSRGNTLYAKLDLGVRIMPGLHMQQAGAIFQQTITEPLLTSVVNNRNISIDQVEYYNKITADLNRKWQLKLAYHFIHTPFNNLIYNNHIGMVGIKYNSHYFDVQAAATVGKLTDSTLTQYDLQVGVYPLGNLNLYGFSTFILRQQNGSAFNFKQVVGGKIARNLWLEGNVTLGNFRNLLENDALYVYNAIDPNTFKGGATLYYTVTKGLVAQLGYTFEQRQLYRRAINYNQQSITGGVSWRF